MASTISEYLNRTLETLPIPDILKPLAYGLSSQIHSLKVPSIESPNVGAIAAMAVSQSRFLGWLGMILMGWFVIASIFSMVRGFLRWMWFFARIMCAVAVVLAVVYYSGTSLTRFIY
ncbi:hypothetical protein SeLEV6574_g06265 [Synchytrium endobioticum]|uniref:Uncharacterized protein n=1 Tax=Synchytrium endobioticum TaxID=286115 RepID=A0A507CPM2_9FUNG|nr:hypothetical protein SeLEV6574_g06265 [Synchytrium endobioticum]